MEESRPGTAISLLAKNLIEAHAHFILFFPTLFCFCSQQVLNDMQ